MAAKSPRTQEQDMILIPILIRLIVRFVRRRRRGTEAAATA
jgi:hypothetical protein